LFIFLISCLPSGDNIVGSFIEVTVTGTYYNELTGEMTTDTEELKAVINLYPLDTGTKVEGGGYFGEGGGLVYSSSTGFDTSSPTVSGSGTAHVNGFIAKGPFTEGSEVTISIINEDMTRFEIDSQFIEQLEGETDNLSEFSIDLPATEDVDININLNSLTFLQTERMYELINNQGMSFYDAYVQSKEEVLSLVNLDSGITEIEDFEKMDIREEGDGNAVLLIANSLLSAEEAPTKQSESLLQKVLEQLKNNGAVINENIGDIIADRFANLDFATIRQLLINYFQGQGQDVNIPDPQEFKDDDHDGIINRYDISIIKPIGEVIITPPNPPDAEFDWSAIPLPPGVDDIDYKVEISTSHLFKNDETVQIIVEDDSLTLDDPTNIVVNQPYFWRVKGIIKKDVNTIEKKWSTSTSFVIRAYSGLPINAGAIESITGLFTPSRQIILNNSEMIGAHLMRFSVNDQNFSQPHEQWMGYELIKRIILPEHTGDYIIYAEFKKTDQDDIDAYQTQTTISLNTDIEVDTNDIFNINNGTSETLSRFVMLELQDSDGIGIKYAYKMRFCNDDPANLVDQPWIPFLIRFPWILSDGDGNKTVYAQFANSQGLTTPIHKEINLTSPTEQATLTLHVGPGILVTVNHYFNGNTNDLVDLVSEYTAIGSPHSIPVKINSVIDFNGEVIDYEYTFEGFYTDDSFSNPLDNPITVSDDFVVYAHSVPNR
jgi:hypothetical protein